MTIVIIHINRRETYWAAVKTMMEIEHLLFELYVTYADVTVYVESSAGKIIMTFQRLVDRIRVVVPGRRSYWCVTGVVV